MKTACTSTAVALLFGLGTVMTALPAHAQQAGVGDDPAVGIGDPAGPPAAIGGPGEAPGRAPHPERPDVELGLVDPQFHARIGPEARQALREAHQALLARDFQRAEQALARADDLIDAEPPRVEGALERAEEAIDRGDLQAARQAIWEAQQAMVAPGRAPAPMPPGVTELERQQPTAAPGQVEPFQRTETRIDPRVREALQAARTAALQGDLDGAERALEWAEERLDEGRHPQLQQAIERAERAIDDDDVDAAQQALGQARQAMQPTAAPWGAQRPGPAQRF